MSPAVHQFIERSLGHEIISWPPRSWDLVTLTLAAYYFQPDLDVAQAQRLSAQAGVITAGAHLSSSIGVILQRNMDAPADSSPWTYGLGLDVPIETAGKRDGRAEQARYLVLASRLREVDTMWQVRSRVRSSLLVAYSIEALLRHQNDLQAQIIAILESRLAAGYAAQSEVTQSHLALNRSTLALQENQKQSAENLVRIAAAVGVLASTIEGIAISFSTFDHLLSIAELPPEEARRQALLNRPDILAKLADYEASQSVLQLEVAKQYPDVTLGPGFSWDAGAVKWSLGLSLVLPLFNRNEGPIAEAEARRKEAAAAFLSAQAGAISEVEQAVVGYHYAVRVFDTADLLLRNQKKEEDAVVAAFQAGEEDRMTWLSEQYDTATAELARASALLQAQQALGRLEEALRTPVSADGLSLAVQEAALSKRSQ